MEEFTKGTKFIVDIHKELEKKGWTLGYGYHSEYTHDDFNGVLTWQMIETYGGKALTVKDLAVWSFLKHQEHDKWYTVEENKHQWPVSVFLEITEKSNFLDGCIGGCIEGMTPIDGWFICKTCGDNLREIKI